MIKRYAVDKDFLFETDIVTGLPDYVEVVLLTDIKDSLIVWQKVEDELPKKNGMYFVQSKRHVPVTANYSVKYDLWQLFIPATPLLFQPELKDIIEWAYIKPPKE